MDSKLPRPVRSGVVAVTAHGDTTCATLADGTLACWGDGRYGQLGDGLRDTAAAPIVVTSAGMGLSAFAVGERHVCAATGKDVACWGSGGSGALGDPTVAVRAPPASARVCP